MVMRTEGAPVGRRNYRSRLARQLAASWVRVIRECTIKREESVTRRDHSIGEVDFGHKVQWLLR